MKDSGRKNRVVSGGKPDGFKRGENLIEEIVKNRLKWALQPKIYMKKLKSNIRLMEVASAQP